MTINDFLRTVESELETRQLAADFAKCVQPGLTISMNATLGAGKTRFAQAFAEACDVPAGAVVSPTYVICQEYAGASFDIHHLDVYRLTSDDEFLELGSDELFAGSSVKLIEWGEQVVSCLPDDRIDLQIAVTGETSRTFVFRSTGPVAGQTVKSLQAGQPTLIYKITPRSLWEASAETGTFKGAPIDLEDGFIHFSAAHQVAATASKHFAGQTELLLVATDTSSLGESLRWEASRGGDLFPHLYGELPVALSTNVTKLEDALADF